MFAIALICCGLAKAQKVLLPFGQFTHQPWSARYFHSAIGGETPSANWYSVKFDDSSWGTIEGPISTNYGIEFRATPWENNYSTYWVRRHFKANNISDYSSVLLYLYHDDGCEIYLNGSLIYYDENYYTDLVTITMTDEMCSHFVEGDNVIAIKVSDSGGGEAFMDFGLYGYTGPIINNNSFEDGTRDWNISGSDLRRMGQRTNYLMRSENTHSFDAHQEIYGGKRGLYRLRAQAFQMQGDGENAWGLYKKIPVDTRLYINDTETLVKNIFDDAVSTNTYSSGDWLTTGETTFVPYNANMASIAFTNGLYDNELYAYIDRDTITIGIKKDEGTINQWTCFDNFRLDYIREQDFAKIADSVSWYLSAPLYSDYKTQLTALQSELKAATDYVSKSKVIIKYSPLFADIRLSRANYSALSEVAKSLQKRLGNASNSSPATTKEATSLVADVNTAITKGSYTNKECKTKLAELEEIIKRLDYNYLFITINNPGSLGDSILNKVEFNQVQSLKLSGTLNDADMNIIKTRLTALCELDMTDVLIDNLPARLLYQHKQIERIVMPLSLLSISEYAFYECPALCSVTFGPKLEIIGSNAFRRCPTLKDFVLPSSLKTIEEQAFRGCQSLKEVILPEGLTTMGEYAFCACSSLERVTFPTTLKSIPPYSFQSCLLSDINFSEGLTSIGYAAFVPRTGYDTSCDGITRRYYNNTLEHVKFPSTLALIEGEAFSQNKGLVNIEFNEGLCRIDDDAFSRCEALTEITLPSSLVLVYGTPFSYCYNLSKVTSLSLEPPFMSNQLFFDVNMDGRELYAPAISINAYKMATGWDQFPIILPIEHLPANITVLGDFHLTLPSTIPTNYKPNVSLIHDKKGTYKWNYGSLTVNGAGVLSLNDFYMIWDPNIQYNEYDNPQNYCTLVNNSQLRADNVMIDTYTRNNRWTFISFPFDIRLSDIETLEEGTTNWVIRKYDGQRRAAGETGSTWVRLTKNDVLQAGEGYILQSSRYINDRNQDYSGFCMKAVNNDKKNNIFQREDAVVVLKEYESEFGHNRSWNLIGNPYPCYYDTRFMDYNAPITVWNINRNTYEAYNPADDSYVLCPGEAFFVQCPVGSPNLLFAKEGRQTTREVRTLGSSSVHQAKAVTTPRSLANFILSDGSNKDRTRIVINECATMQYEQDKDAAKFFSTDMAIPQIYTKYDGVKYAINERPQGNGLVNLALFAGNDGVYSIELAENVKGYTILLEDKLKGDLIKMTPGSPYEFDAKKGTYESRFVLHFTNGTTSVVDIDSEQHSNTAPLYSIEGVKLSNPIQKGVYIQNGKKVIWNK